MVFQRSFAKIRMIIIIEKRSSHETVVVFVIRFVVGHMTA